MSKEADALRKAFMEYEEAVKAYNQQQSLKHAQSGAMSPFPRFKVPSFEDFRYWIYQTGDYAPNGDERSSDD